MGFFDSLSKKASAAYDATAKSLEKISVVGSTDVVGALVEGAQPAKIAVNDNTVTAVNNTFFIKSPLSINLKKEYSKITHLSTF